eukprot:COSAG01_NODE_1626_length_9689_cov_12.495412_2_plen_91_part_00
MTRTESAAEITLRFCTFHSSVLIMMTPTDAPAGAEAGAPPEGRAAVHLAVGAHGLARLLGEDAGVTVAGQLRPPPALEVVLPSCQPPRPF